MRCVQSILALILLVGFATGEASNYQKGSFTSYTGPSPAPLPTYGPVPPPSPGYGPPVHSYPVKDPCYPSPCGLCAECTVLESSGYHGPTAQCTCKYGFEVDSDSYKQSCVPVDPCKADPCKKNQVCTVKKAHGYDHCIPHKAVCSCEEGYEEDVESGEGGCKRIECEEGLKLVGSKCKPFQKNPYSCMEICTLCNQSPLNEFCTPEIEKTCKSCKQIEQENAARCLLAEQNQDECGWIASENFDGCFSLRDVTFFKTGEHEFREEDLQLQSSREKLEKITKAAKKVADKTHYEVFATDANDQGVCRSCSAFATAAAIETCIDNVLKGSEKFFNSPPRELSSQNLLDCAYVSLYPKEQKLNANSFLSADNTAIEGYNWGCQGGKSCRYMEYMKGKTLDSGRKYPYNDAKLKYEVPGSGYRKCYQNEADVKAVVDETYFSWEHHTETDLENILLGGHAIVTTMFVPANFRCYKAGIFEDEECMDWQLGATLGEQWNTTKQKQNHAVTIIGFGEEECEGKVKKYWKAKNSWGENWGESGFFRIIRKKSQTGGIGHCGFGAYFSVATCKLCGDAQCTEHIDNINKNSPLPPKRPLPTTTDSEGNNHVSSGAGSGSSTTFKPSKRPGRGKRAASYGSESPAPAIHTVSIQPDLSFPKCSGNHVTLDGNDEVTECPIFENGKLKRFCPIAPWNKGNGFCLDRNPECRQATQAEVTTLNGESAKQMCFNIA